MDIALTQLRREAIATNRLEEKIIEAKDIESFWLTLPEAGKGRFLPANFWKAHRTKSFLGHF